MKMSWVRGFVGDSFFYPGELNITKSILSNGLTNGGRGMLEKRRAKREMWQPLISGESRYGCLGVIIVVFQFFPVLIFFFKLGRENECI